MITTATARTINWANVTYMESPDGYADVARIDIEGRGIRCNIGTPHRHANVDTLKACHLEADSMRAQYEAEIYAEGGLVRMLENQGTCYGVPNYTDPQGGSCLCC